MFSYPCNADGKDASAGISCNVSAAFHPSPALSVASAIAKVRVLAAVGRIEDNAEQGEAPLSSTNDADVGTAAAVDLGFRFFPG